MNINKCGGLFSTKYKHSRLRVYETLYLGHEECMLCKNNNIDGDLNIAFPSHSVSSILCKFCNTYLHIRESLTVESWVLGYSQLLSLCGVGLQQVKYEYVE